MTIEKAPINPLIQNTEGMPYGEQVRDYCHQYYLKQIAMWAEEICSDHHLAIQLIRRRQCLECWQSLLKDAGEDNG